MLTAQELGFAVENDMRWVENIRGIAQKYLIPDTSSEDYKDPKKMAEATLAVESVLAIVNIFKALLSGSPVAGTSAIVDLTYNLNSNAFWVRNSGYLMPLVTSAINSALDHGCSSVDKDTPLWGKLYYHNRYAWLDVVVAVVFLMKGFSYIRKNSLEIKKSFEGFV